MRKRKINPKVFRQIKGYLRGRISASQIERMFDISDATLSHIRRAKTYRGYRISIGWRNGKQKRRLVKHISPKPYTNQEARKSIARIQDQLIEIVEMLGRIK